MSAIIGEKTTMKQLPRFGRACGQGRHLIGVCSHPGSKPNTDLIKIRNRKAGKVARRSRKINR